MIKDFGAKIGGARKDIWRKRGLMLEDLEGMTDFEKRKYVVKDYVWPKPDMRKLLKVGFPRSAVYWGNEIRKTVYAAPKGASDEEYIAGVHLIRCMVESVHSEEDILAVAKKMRDRVLLKKGYRIYDYADGLKGIFDGNKILKLTTESGFNSMKRKMDKEHFGLSQEEILNREWPIVVVDGSRYSVKEDYNGKTILIYSEGGGKYFYYPIKSIELDKCSNGTFALLHGSKILCLSSSEKTCMDMRTILSMEEDRNDSEKKAGKRKKKWTPPQFKSLEREGKDFRQGMHVSGDSFISDFGIRGGEFGNWTNESERQASLDMAYDALADLAIALKIDQMDISLHGLSCGGLAIAFGARGRGNALAHYEPGREVINITKLRGAGSLGHEWGHALDDLIGKLYGKQQCMATENWRNKEIPTAFQDVMRAILYTDGKMSDYYTNSVKFGALHTKAGHGYWQSNCELFARAFACYVLDRTSGINDYLSGHAELCVDLDDEGKEREKINKCFDGLIAYLKQQGIFHERKVIIPTKMSPEKNKTVSASVLRVMDSTIPFQFMEQKNGQLYFV